MRSCLILLPMLCAIPAAGAELRFESAALDWGLEFRHHHCGSGEYYMVETLGSGVVVFDYDGDGDADVFFVDSGFLPGCEGEAPVSRLYRNDATAEGPRFVDVTERSGIRVTAYGLGATAGDVDDDGDLDLYVSSFGANQLFVNDGDGTFTDMTARAGVGDPLLGASAAFADADGDGDLDLYVANYVDFSLDNNIVCGENKYGFRSYCHPDVYNGVGDRYFKNRGDGTFEDATAAAGFANARGKGFGVAWSDLNGDGRLDVYVANDMTFNFQFENRGDGTFEDVAILTGTATSDLGKEEASMGIAVGDLDGNQRPDIFLTHIDFETNALYSNVGGDLFVDHRFVSGLAEPSIKKVGFGTAAGDFDLDGDLDLAVANGHIIPGIESNKGLGTSYRQGNQLFENTGGGRFREVERPGFDAVRVSRGLAHGDFDLDGDLDLVINNSNGLAEVYRNVTPSGGGWLKLDVAVESGGNRYAIGAWVEVRNGTARQVAEVRTASSYLSQNDVTLHFGLSAAESVHEILVRRGGRSSFKLRKLVKNRRLRLALDE